MQKYEIEDAIEAFFLSYSKFQNRNYVKLRDLSDGLMIAQMLTAAQKLEFDGKDLEESEGKWIVRLSNLKKIVKKLEQYGRQTLDKNLRTKDIDLIEISKNQSEEEILKLFELVIAILMESPYKEDYIQKIMTLPERHQTVFVNIIQNALESRISQSHQMQVLKKNDELSMLKKQNKHLKEELAFFSEGKKKLMTELEELKEKHKATISELQAIKFSQGSKVDESLMSQFTQQRNITESLKAKLITIARQHQVEISKYKEEISILSLKIQHTEDLENTAELYKQKFTESLKDDLKRVQWQREKIEFAEKIKEKDAQIDALQTKIQTIQSSNRYNDKSASNKIDELSNRNGMLKQLQNHRVGLGEPLEKQKKIQQIIMEQSLDDERFDNREEQMEFLKIEVEKLRTSNRQLQRESLKNRRKVEKFSEVEKEKKKLEKAILEITRSRDSQIELLVSSLWQLRNQNFKIFHLLKISQSES